MKRFLLVAFSLAGLAGVSSGWAGEQLTYVDLVKRLTDLERLSVLPPPGLKCRQWSSYDRKSTYDTKTGKYLGWSANRDGSGIIRKEGDSQVLAEMQGPGVIWRIWSATAGNGHLKIFLDGAAEPAIDLPFRGYFDRKNAPFTYPALVHKTARGFNCYVPIPFQKSCRIVAQKGWGKYYHFTYQTFPQGTVLPTFKRQLSTKEKAALETADKLLTAGLGADPAGQREGEVIQGKDLTIPAGATATVAKITGERALTALKVKIDFKDREEECLALRQLVLRITWDDGKSPAVWAPLGDFFGTAPGINKYKSLPLGMTAEGFYSYWYMPFAKSAHIELVNEGKAKRSLKFSITHAPLSRPVAQLGRFHAKWHRDVFLPEDPDRRKIDWTMLTTKGRGRYCGVMLHIWNPKGGWWGEGDEKFFVDGESFPSTFGTGSEDYFGYAWCDPGFFQNAYHNQTIDMGNRGHISVNRWHIADDVPFMSSFEGAIEKYYPNKKPTLYACTVYWYLEAGGTDPYQPVPVKERTDYYDYVTAPVFKIEGALEAENLKIVAKTGRTYRQNMWRWGDWSGNEQLEWSGAKPGDKLVFAFDAPQAGRYQVTAYLTMKSSYGKHQLFINGKKAGEPMDLFRRSWRAAPTGARQLGGFDLKEKDNRLTVEVVGPGEKSKRKSYVFGLDAIVLKPE